MIFLFNVQLLRSSLCSLLIGQSPRFDPHLCTIAIYSEGAELCRGRGSSGGGRGSSGGVRARRGWRRVQVVGVAALGVRRRRAALAVLLCRQVLAAGGRGGRERLRVVVEVAGVALDGGAGLDGGPTPRRVVAVTHVSAAGGGGRGKVAVGVGPIAGDRAAADEERHRRHAKLS